MTESSTPTSAVFVSPEFELDTAADNTTTFNIIEGNISGTVNLSSLAEAFVVPEVENSLGLEPGTIPSSQTFSEDLPGSSITFLNDPAQYEDGDITLDSPLLSSLLGFTATDSIEAVLDIFDVDLTDSLQNVLDVLEITDAQDGIDILDSLFNVTFTDDDNGTPETNNDFLTTEAGVTGFDFNYFSEQNALIIDGFNPDVVDGVFTGLATIEASGTLSVSLVLSEFNNLVETLREPLGLSLSPNLATNIALYQALFGDEFPLASGSFDLSFSMTPGSEPLVEITNPLAAVSTPVILDVA
jgi:hypothetical protein